VNSLAHGGAVAEHETSKSIRLRLRIAQCQTLLLQFVQMERQFLGEVIRHRLHRLHHARDGLDQHAPAGMLEHGLFFAGARQRVIPRATSGSGNTPLLFQETFRLKPPESGIERSMLHLEQILRSLTDGFGNLVTIGLALLEHAQDHHIQRSLQNVDLSGICHE
jgi:hypothetical protein